MQTNVTVGPGDSLVSKHAFVAVKHDLCHVISFTDSKLHSVCISLKQVNLE